MLWGPPKVLQLLCAESLRQGHPVPLLTCSGPLLGTFSETGLMAET